MSDIMRWCLQEKLHAKPLFASQRPEKRVIRLPAGAPALLSVPGPNEANDNSAVVLIYQVKTRYRPSPMVLPKVATASAAPDLSLKCVEQASLNAPFPSAAVEPSSWTRGRCSPLSLPRI